MKRGCLIPLIALMMILCIIVAVVGFLLMQTPAARPSVLINSPRNGERVAVGQETNIHAVARDAEKIKRVELWVDGVLRDAQTSSVPGGISPFPLMTNWRPPTPGAHNLIVRAYNARNGRGEASISIDATQTADRDGDGVRDSEDACPDQPGLPAARGCPAPSANDRDGDGIADGADACPDQAGSPLAQGCPNVDNDGVRDSEDACPREPGPAERRGCPVPGDADADGVPDASDACPRDAGPGSTLGCPDSDGDGVADRDDACAGVPGVPGLGGCPDRDGDGVRDLNDLCPDVPGPASNAGCPLSGAGDGDGDGVRDDTDLSPSEPGPAESGGAPRPGDGAFEDLDPLGGFFGDIFAILTGTSGTPLAKTLVQVEALEFEVRHDYSEIFCYAGVPDAAMELYGPFHPLGNRQWNIAEYIGGRNSRTIPVLLGEPLRLRIECMGYESAHGEDWGAVAYFDLGSVTRSYPMGQWDGHVITELSGMRAPERGDPGHSFTVKFRLCLRSCEATAFPPPELGLHRVPLLTDFRQLRWTWEGNPDNITGYMLYINGNRRVEGIDAWQSSFNLTFEAYRPPCGETYTYYITAYRGTHADRRESPPSNSVSWEGAPCPRRVRVTFVRAYAVSEEWDDFRGGPYYGSFWALGNREERLRFSFGDCRSFLWVFRCVEGLGYDVFAGNVADMFARVRASGSELSGWDIYAPMVNHVIVELGAGDDLTIGGRVMDRDAYGGDDTLFETRRTIRAGEPLPAELELTDRGGYLRVQIEELRGP